ncbi:EAL domain-containing protein [Rhizobiaceae bacterium BDR2-2]|uniref:EAL domain-containing protein n=1 Tax=Ectorhizobium quercum TaxID=2965071 RepID=A0AAE3MYW9_9HYPH|nr:EAL domain-containing protein [Ectorhizobium quercum]MCX8996856.1 EAL domain-containing protein [Ectorhizobium quercum]
MAEGVKIEGKDIHLSLTGSLHRHRWPQLIGAVVSVLCFSVVWGRTQSPIFMVLVACALGILLLRLGLTLWLGRLALPVTDVGQARQVELIHITGSTLTAALIGGGTGYAVLAGIDSFSVFICISVIMALMVTVAGRSYGSPASVDIQVALLVLPPALAGLFSGDVSVIIMCLLLVPLGFETRVMARGIRNAIGRSIVAAEQLSTILGRFNAALDTMPHGLIMLDADRRVLIANRRARAFFGGGQIEGTAIADLVPAGLKDVCEASAAGFGRRLAAFVDGDFERTQIPLANKIYLEFDGAGREDGSTVIIFEDVTARVRAEEKILHMAKFDALTGLPNRHHFAEQVRQVLERLPAGVTVGFMLIDVDDLKNVNDVRGHAFGDKLLNEIGRRFSGLVDTETISARMISDQFGVFFFGRDGEEGALKTRILHFHAALQANYSVGEVVMPLSFSAGYVLLANREAEIEEWQVKADLALSEAKVRARGLCVGYAREMDERYIASRKLKADLRQTLQDAGLTTMFQPMYRADGTRIECCEALVRWTHPQRGPVSPDVFIRMAEDMGVVSTITRFVLDRACRECMRWPGHIAVSVNLSAHDLRNHDIVELVADTLAATGLSPSRLHLEVTESCLMDEPLAAGALLSELRAMGITIAVDDFGTGFSSLAYLDTLPLDVVKIDRSFVRNVTSDERRLKLLKGTVNLVRALGLNVVVEGVETEEQLAVIVENGAADLVQGFVFSRPLTSEQILALTSA